MNKYKYHIFVLIILITIIWYRFWHQSPPTEVLPSIKTSLSTSSIKPVEISEPFITWYLGDIAVDIPKSIGLNSSFQFSIRPDASNRNITIGFSDISVEETKNKNYSLTSSEPLYRSASQVFFWEPTAKKTENISMIIGKPAGLSIFYGPDNIAQNRWALGMDVRIKEDYGYLELDFTEFVFEPLSSEQLTRLISQKKEQFIFWIHNFLNAYNWTGHNQKPGHNQLATRRGIINAEKFRMIDGISVTAFFDSPDDAHHPTDKNQIALTRFFITGICPSNENLADTIYKNSAGYIRIFKEWMIPIDSAIYGSICVTMMTIASAGDNDHEAQSYIMGLSNAVLKSLRSAI